MAFAAFIRIARFNDAVTGLSVRQDGSGNAYEAIGPNSTPYFVGTRAGEAQNVYEVVPITNGVEIRLGPGGSTAPDVILRRNTADTLTIVGTVAFNSGINIPNGNGIVIGHTGEVTNEGSPELQVLGTGADDSAITLGRWADDANQPLLHFVKSRNAAIGSTNTIVADGDLLGGLIWLPDDGTDLDTQAARFHVEVEDTSPAAGDIGVVFVWSLMSGGGEALAEVMRLRATTDAGGRLGLGIEPTATATGRAGPLLHVETSALNNSAQLILRSTNTGGSGSATIFLGAADGASGNPEIIFAIEGGTARTFRIANDNSTPSQLIFTRDGVGTLLSLASNDAIFGTQTVRISPGTGDSPRLLITNSQVSATGNIARVTFNLLSDSQARDAAVIVGSFSTIADASRIGLLEFQVADGGATATRMSIEGSNVQMANDVALLSDVNSGLTASTTQTQGNGALTADVNEVSTVGSADDTVTLPTAVIGRKVAIINNGANQLRIFPASGDNLGQGADTAVALASGSNIVFLAFDVTNWEIV